MMTMDLATLLAEELSLRQEHVAEAMKLFDEGGTVPFIARYRKERTGSMDEVALRSLQERRQYLSELSDRKATILASIQEQGKLTPVLKADIEACLQKAALEDLYLPYRPKRRTRATKAREQGLEPLADWVRAHNRPGESGQGLAAEADKYIDPEKGIETAAAALQGAADILAEEVAEQAALRAYIRTYLHDHGAFAATVKAEHPEGTTNYEMYRDYQAPVRSIPAHNMLALRRGEKEGLIALDLTFDEAHVLAYLAGQVVQATGSLGAFLEQMVADAFSRLMKHTLVGEVRLAAKEKADETSTETFAANLRDLLLASPAGMRPTLALDPGFRTGCKTTVLDTTGRLLTHTTLYPHQGARQRQEAAHKLVHLVQQHKVELIAVGNGTAGRETEAFVAEALKGVTPKPICVMVNEAGASVYSASPEAIEEFPALDVTVRGSISIGRRLQDPLAELVKIDPKSIGVGQYQHDVDQRRLKEKLAATVESCVNYVGVNLNTASASLLGHVAGITPAVAKNIVAHRDAHGAYADREALRQVPRFGPKAFEQAAGFLRIREGHNPLDNTAVHPEAYPVVARMAEDLQVPLAEITHHPDRLKRLDLRRYTTPGLGEPTLRDILAELEKPGRDPREAFTYAAFREDVQDIKDLVVGMELEGVVTNVANFGAFVDIGVHRDGLVHISQLADRYVKDPHTVVKVGQVVKVRVTEVDAKRKRISLSMRAEKAPEAKQKGEPRKQKGGAGGKRRGRQKGKAEKPRAEKPSATLEDLVRKFNTR